MRPGLPDHPADVRPRRYDPPHVLWYFGAITAAFAASATIAEVDASHRGIWQLLVSLLFIGAFVAVAALLLRAGWWVPGGVLVVAAVSLVPAAGHAFERLIGVWPNVAEEGPGALGDFQGEVFALLVATIIVGVLAFRIVAFPFVFLPVAASTLIAAELLVPLLVDDPRADDYAKAILVTGAAFVLIGLVLDSSARRSVAFWWHVVGLLAVAGGLGYYAIVRDPDWAWIAVLVVGATLLLASAPLLRATWATYGVIGTYVGVLHYVEEWFGTWEAATLMALVSLGLILVGVWFQLYDRLWQRFGGLPTLPPTAPPPAETAPAPPVAPPPPEPPPPPPGDAPAAELPPPPDGDEPDGGSSDDRPPAQGS